jgi:fluoride exporter
MKLVLAIAAGGALGAVARHYVSLAVMRMAGSGFPWSTIVVNLLGSFFMGILIELLAQRLNVGVEMRAFLTVGILGAFTTFSAFSLDFVTLFERGAQFSAVSYAALSVVLAIGALFAGLAVMRFVLS